MNKFEIDRITWNDLSMEQVYEKINTADSSVGQEFLKRMLQTTLLEEEPLRKRSLRVDYFGDSAKACADVQKIFRDLGKTKKLSLYEYIFRFNEIKPASNAVHYVLILLLLAAIALIFVKPVIGILALVVMFAVNISSYFKFKSAVEGYFMCFKYIVRMLRAAGRICRLKLQDTPLEELRQQLLEDSTALSALRRGSWLLTNSVSGSLADVVMDYVRMLFHVDIIQFNRMRRIAAEHTETIDRLFCTLGELESDLCISRYRKSLSGWCRPAFSAASGVADSERSASCGSSSGSSSYGISKGQLCFRAKGMYHPLTASVVKNDLDAARAVLLTGSNASGKSTFLKQVAINQIFAQTICTCLADSLCTGFFKVLSSMALSDNILGKESYFIVEIKSLKRILDEIDDSAAAPPVMCLIDEVLRGTNTKERVAASSQILRNMSGRNVLCFAATHDIELTQLLSDCVDNYHFEESVSGNDVKFDYLLRKGPASSRNAIALMRAYGFPAEITDAAARMAEI